LQAARTLRVRAFAKINLGLEVGDVTPDGYHLIRSLMQVIELSDVLTFAFEREREPAATRISCDHPAVPAGANSAENLIFRALCLVDPPGGACVQLKKHIPVGAGLGGGSSDAAAAMAAAAKYFWNRPPEACVDVKMLGRVLGADVPFFIRGGSQVATGVGERLQPVPFCGEYWAVLLHPPYRINTGAAYRCLDTCPGESAPAALSPQETAAGLRDGDLLPVLSGLRNDLERAAFRLQPHLSELRDIFSEAAARSVLMSGSGSSFFTLFQDEERARKTLRCLRETPALRRCCRVDLARFRAGRGWCIAGERGRGDDVGG